MANCDKCNGEYNLCNECKQQRSIDARLSIMQETLEEPYQLPLIETGGIDEDSSS